MRTVLASTATTKTTTRISTTSAGCMVSSFSVPSTNLRVETRYLVHERRRALDLQYVDPRARFDDQVLVVRTGGPQLSVDAHLAAVGGDPLDHEGLPADQSLVSQHQRGAGVQPLDDTGPHQAQRGHRRGTGGENLQGHRQPDEAGDGAHDRTGREH